MVNLQGRFPQSLLIICSFVGCTGVTPVTSGLSSPFFAPTSEDTPRLSKLTHELDNRALDCLEGEPCEQVHFARALVSLFENQEAARASFRQAIEDNPSGSLAASSMLWLQLMEDEGIEHNASNDLIAQLVREKMAHGLTAYIEQERPDEFTTAKKALVEPSEKVQVLQKQVRERDRHIASLQLKLEALKVIDQDHANRTRAIRLPSTLP